MSTKIVEIFIRDHNDILKLIDDFKLTQALKSQDLMLFKRIKWNLERHQYLEEKALFSACEIINSFPINFANELMRQHDMIRALVNEMEVSITKNILVSIHELTGLIDTHIDFERDFYYNKLEKLPNQEQTKFIMNAMNQASNTKFYPIDQLRKYHLKIITKKCS